VGGKPWTKVTWGEVFGGSNVGKCVGELCGGSSVGKCVGEKTMQTIVIFPSVPPPPDFLQVCVSPLINHLSIDCK